MKALLALVFALLIATPAFGAAPPFPWARYSDVAAVNGVRVMGPACGGAVLFILIGEDWRTLSSPTKDIFLYMPSDGLGFAYLTEGSGSDGIITVRRVMTHDDMRRLYPDPCTYFNEVSA